MSVIGETGIGHGGCTTEEEYAEYEKHKNDPPRPSNSIDLSPALKEIKEIRRKSLTSEPSPQTWNNAIEDAKVIRSKSLEIAKGEVAKAFAPELKKIQAKLASTEISADNIDELIGELVEESGIKDIVDNNYKETKKLIDNFREKVAKYPKYISYEGSTVLCVLISVNMSNDINLKGLPLEDRNLILSLLPDNTENKHNAHISVAFDADHDFILTYQGKDDNQQTTINLFNTVIHPNPVSVNIDVPVPVVKDKEKIFVGGGGNIILDKTRIPKLIGVEPHKNNTNEEYTPRRQPVVGRNAYEIREDIMGMALEYSLSNKNKMTPEEIVGVAKIFYSFVENKHR
jgi:hypothetical protein